MKKPANIFGLFCTILCSFGATGNINLNFDATTRRIYPNDVAILPYGASNSVTLKDFINEHGVSLKRFGGSPGVDSTDAFNKAQAFLGAAGGKIYFGEVGNWIGNYVITNNVWLEGSASGLQIFAGQTYRNSLSSADTNLPTVTIGNDTHYISHVKVSNIAFTGGNSNNIALAFRGGAIDSVVEDCTFSHVYTAIHARSGTNFPTQKLTFLNCNIWSSAGLTNANLIDLQSPAYTSTNWLTAFKFYGGSIVSSLGDTATNTYICVGDGISPEFYGTYFDFGTNGIFALKNTYSVSILPRFFFMNCQLDGDDTSPVVLIDYYTNNIAWAGSPIRQNQQLGTNNYVRLSDGKLLQLAGGSTFGTGVELPYPFILGGIYFGHPDTATNQYYQQTRGLAIGAEGSLSLFNKLQNITMYSSNTVSIVGTNTLQLYSPNAGWVELLNNSLLLTNGQGIYIPDTAGTRRKIIGLAGDLVTMLSPSNMNVVTIASNGFMRFYANNAAILGLQIDKNGVSIPYVGATNVPYLNNSGYWQRSGVTPTVFGYISNLTSDAQTQINGKVSTNITVTGILSLTGGGALVSNQQLSLVNDEASPGNSEYYGTDSGGTKGFFSLPSAPTIEEQDGGPSVSFNTLKFPNGTLIDEGSGVVSVSVSGGSGMTNVFVNGTIVAAPNFKTGSKAIIAIENSTNIVTYPTNLVDADIAAVAGIDATKIGGGFVTTTEFSYIGGLTSDAQNQLDAKQALDSDLTALAGIATTGLYSVTGVGTSTTINTTAGINSLTTDDDFVTLGGVETITGNKTFSGAILQPADAIASTDIDWSAGNTFTKTIGSNTTFTFSGASSGQWITVKVTASGSYTITWPTVTWKDGSTPVQTASKTDFYTFFYDGSTYYGAASQNY